MNNLRTAGLALPLILICSIAASAAPSLVGVVTKVHDADTITVAVKIRLHYVDAPELSQPHGKESADFARELLLGRSVELRPVGRSYDRVVSDVGLGGLDVARLLTEQGHVMLDPRFKPPAVLLKAQEDAKAERFGIWKAKDVEPPWVFRKRRKAK